MTEVSPAKTKRNQNGGKLPLIALGFSVRALAQALRPLTDKLAGLDHFGDQDLIDACDSWLGHQSWDQTPETIREIVSELRTLRWAAIGGADSWRARVLLGGGTENWPELVAALHQNFEVLGPCPMQLSQLRSVENWRRWAADSGLHFPSTQLPPRETPTHSQPGFSSAPESKTWLAKSIRGSGGLGVRDFDTSVSFSSADYLQHKIEGRCLGVTCILEPSGSSFLGATEAFSSREWPAPGEYIYRGSWGEIQLCEQTIAKVQQLANLVHAETGLLGWLQMDFIEDPAGDLWLIEFNPRWTAGMEVLLDCGTNPALHHLRAWGCEPEASSLLAPEVPRPITCAKAITYTPREVTLNGEAIEKLHALPRDHFADIPATQMTAAVISTGQPLLTVRSWTPQTGNPAKDKAMLLEHLNALREQALGIL